MPESERPATEDWTVEQVKEQLESNPNLILIDVREPWEWNQGHLEGAQHIPMNTIPQQAKSLDQTQDIVVYCHLGGRSDHVAQHLRQQWGMKNVHNMIGGIEMWMARRFPVVQ